MNELLAKEMVVKYQVSEKEVNSVINDCVAWMKSHNYSDAEITVLLPKRVSQTLRQRKRSPGQSYTGWILAEGRFSNFSEINKNNTQKKIEEIKNNHERLGLPLHDLTNTLVKEGLVNAKGELLYSSGFDKGKPIPAEPIYSKPVIAIAKLEDAPYEMFLLELNGEKALEQLPMNLEVKFEARPSLDVSKLQKKGYAGLNCLKSLPTTNFEVIGNYINTEFLDKLIAEKYNMLGSTIAALHNIIIEGFSAFFVIRADIVPGSLWAEQGKTPTIKINDDSMPDVDVTGFLNKGAKIDFVDGAPGCIMFVKPSKNKKKNEDDPDINLNVMGVIVEPQFRVGTDEVLPIETEAKEKTGTTPTIEDFAKPDEEAFEEGSNDEKSFGV